MISETTNVGYFVGPLFEKSTGREHYALRYEQKPWYLFWSSSQSKYYSNAYWVFLPTADKVYIFAKGLKNRDIQNYSKVEKYLRDLDSLFKVDRGYYVFHQYKLGGEDITRSWMDKLHGAIHFGNPEKTKLVIQKMNEWIDTGKKQVVLISGEKKVFDIEDCFESPAIETKYMTRRFVDHDKNTKAIVKRIFPNSGFDVNQMWEEDK
jgi:hypothetical protein